MHRLKLYYCRDSRALRPLWALEELALPYEMIGMTFPPRFTYEGYRDINTLGTVPTLIDGDLTMTESSAMCQYLVDKYVPESELSVKPNEAAYGDYLNWLHRSDSTFTFPQAIYLRYAIFEKEENRQPKVAEDYIIWLFSRLKAVEQTLNNSTYLCVDRFTMADICVGYSLYLAKLLGFEERLGPNTQNYLTMLIKRPAFQRCLDAQSNLPPLLSS